MDLNSDNYIVVGTEDLTETCTLSLREGNGCTSHGWEVVPNDRIYLDESDRTCSIHALGLETCTDGPDRALNKPMSEPKTEDTLATKDGELAEDRQETW